MANQIQRPLPAKRSTLIAWSAFDGRPVATVRVSQVRVDGDAATSRCYLQAQHVVGAATFLLGGRYEDRLVRTADGWRIAHRDLITMWTTGDPSILGR